METKKNIYFLSDFHLGLASYEYEKAKEERIIRFLQSIEQDAKAVYLLGDIFDFWFEYRDTVPKGFVAFMAQIKHMTQIGIEVNYFRGNHDLWQRDYFRKELGVNIYRKNIDTIMIDNKTFVVGHGDGLDDKDWGYKAMDAVFSNHFFWWLFSLLPGCVGLSLARRWSRGNRVKHAKYDAPDSEYNTTNPKRREPMKEFCQNYLKTKHVDYFIFGHRHIKSLYSLEGGSKYLNTGAWIKDSPYGIWDGNELLLKTYEDNKKIL
jgi:UDP-2,3-diacylglucosamine hydrolase